MTPAALVQPLQIAVGLALVCYSAALLVQKAREIKWRMPAWFTQKSSDLRTLVDMAERFRDAGNVSAVAACQALIDELLKPKTT